MKKKYVAIIVAVILILSIIAGIAVYKKGQTNKPEDVETMISVVTDESGEAVTDDKGRNVTEIVTVTKDVPDYEDDTDDTKPSPYTSNGSDKSTKKNEKTDKDTPTKAGEKTTKSKDKTTKNGTTKKTTTTTTKKETTTKPKKRKVTVRINIPYYDSINREMTVYYKILGEDKEYTALDPIDIVMNNSYVDVDLGRLKGDVRVVVKISGMSNISDNKVTIKADKNYGEITIVTGIEKIDGGMD